MVKRKCQYPRCNNNMKIKLSITVTITNKIIIVANYCRKHYIRKELEYNIARKQELKQLQKHNQPIYQEIFEILEI